MLLKAAHRLTADLMQPRPLLYWADLIASASVGYVSLALAIASTLGGLRVAAAIVAVLALYRALLFIHELTHVRLSTLPGFWTAWNVLVGIPLLMPSFFYEGVHTLHHAKSHYGTVRDPEYLPLARTRPLHLILFLLVSVSFPVVLLVRSALLVPLAALFPRLRELVWERLSALTINPEFRRPHPTPTLARRRFWLEAVTSVYAWGLVALALSGAVAASTVAIVLAVAAGISLVNQFRTLVAHHWENDGEEMDAVGQLLDTVNVPPPGLLPMLWAPVGLRYHGLHHFLPGLPYHNLGAAHRRMVAELPADAAYQRTSSRNAAEVIARLLRHQAQVRLTGAEDGAAIAEPARPHC
ncbi:MAG TPA: fatty acid desaturase [Stellaceae bacterium]|nr:fatty acid desaturase [Stellaceae bacterium]